jgi:predicted DNA-binding protein (MmcQ/YjbR family)
MNGQFVIMVTVSPDGSVCDKVTDSSSGEEYVLHRLAGSAGAFVGSVREAREAILQEIAEKCFDRDSFKGEYVKEVIRYVREKHRAEPEYLWEKFPTSAIWRRSDNRKWFGVLLTVPRKKLGIGDEELVEIVDLRTPPEELAALVDGKRYFPGYHMNKKHWLTVCLDGSVPIEEICGRIDVSCEIAAKK